MARRKRWLKFVGICSMEVWLLGQYFFSGPGLYEESTQFSLKSACLGLRRVRNSGITAIFSQAVEQIIPKISAINQRNAYSRLKYSAQQLAEQLRKELGPLPCEVVSGEVFGGEYIFLTLDVSSRLKKLTIGFFVENGKIIPENILGLNYPESFHPENQVITVPFSLEQWEKIVEIFAAKAAKQSLPNPQETLLAIAQTQGINRNYLERVIAQSPWLMERFLDYVRKFNEAQFIKENSDFTPLQRETIKDEVAYQINRIFDFSRDDLVIRITNNIKTVRQLYIHTFYESLFRISPVILISTLGMVIATGPVLGMGAGLGFFITSAIILYYNNRSVSRDIEKNKSSLVVDDKIYIHPRSTEDLNELRVDIAHEIQHALRNMGEIKTDLYSGAYELLRLSELGLIDQFGTYKRPWFEKGREIMNQSSDPKIHATEILGRLGMPPSLSLQGFDTWWNYAYGYVLGGMAYELGKQIVEQKREKPEKIFDYAYQYLNLIARDGKDIAEAEKIVREI